MLYFKKTIKTLFKKNISMSIAESCTGGQLSIFFTNIPGISKIFDMGLITYSNVSKTKILKIKKAEIVKHGAVSERVAFLMSSYLFKISKSKLCISTTGIAGPSGNTKEKPIGLVYIGITYKNKTDVFKKKFKGNRKKIQKDTVNFCLRKIANLI